MRTPVMAAHTQLSETDSMILGDNVADAKDALLTLDRAELDVLEALGARRSAGSRRWRVPLPRGRLGLRSLRPPVATVDILVGVGANERVVRRAQRGAVPWRTEPLDPPAGVLIRTSARGGRRGRTTRRGA